ncbi:hypothetical protein GE061_014411 [Apolygus lucorum]|uniref:Uncharacterized protein n=1 Tax=Apolygus lucorum TaxID=248454 RepID=A0A8S9XRP3_APOLU|nr:hypothetical protein GE061_014411 [Apolygus lucorum]
MSKYQVHLAAEASSTAEKTTVIKLKAIRAVDEETWYGFPEELQALSHHKKLTELTPIKNAISSIKARGQYRKRKIGISNEWGHWKDNLISTFSDDSWNPVRFAYNFRHIVGSYVDFVIKKERLLLDLDHEIPDDITLNLIVLGLPIKIQNELSRSSINSVKILIAKLKKFDNAAPRRSEPETWTPNTTPRPKTSEPAGKYHKATEGRKACTICQKQNRAKDGGSADVSADISAIQDYRTSSNEPSLDHLSDNLSQSAPDVNGGRRKRAHEELIDHKSEDDIVVQAECAPPSPDEPPVKPVLDPSLEEYLLMEDDGGIAELIDIIPPPKEEMTPKTEGVGQPGSTNPGTVGSPATPLDIDTLPSTSELCERSTVPPNDAPEEWSPNLVVPGPSTAEPVVEAMMEEEEPIEPPPRYTFRQRVPVDYSQLHTGKRSTH